MRDNSWKGFFAVFLAVTTASVSPTYADWNELGFREMYRIVYVSPEDIHDTRVYWGAIRELCSAGHCNILFVRDKAMGNAIGRRISDTEFKEALLIYNTDKGFSWNCTLRPTTDNCFAS